MHYYEVAMALWMQGGRGGGDRDCPPVLLFVLFEVRKERGRDGWSARAVLVTRPVCRPPPAVRAHGR